MNRYFAMVFLGLSVAVAGLAGAPAGAQERGREPLGIVSLRITVQNFDPALPWNKRPERMVLGNALVVEKGLLLTTAFLVKNATLIEARKMGRYPDFQARVVLVDYELDLALLAVEAEKFWEGLQPLPISARPPDSGRLFINRWRHNGRFEQGSAEVVEMRVATSRFGNLEFPELRGTTAMSGLGWGEVITTNGQVVGLISSHSERDFHATSSPLLKLFIAAARQSPYRGFAHRGFSWQRLNHPDLRAAYGLAGNDSGVLVRRVYAGGTGSRELKKGDILLKIGKHPINPEGKIFHPLYGQILFTIALNESLDETISATVIREGRTSEMALTRRLFSAADYRIHPYRYDQPLEFEMFAGLVLQELSLDYLRLWGGGWQQKAPTRLVMEYFLNQVREAGRPEEKVVVITRVLPDAVNLGYDDVGNAILLRANGRPLSSLQAFRDAVSNPKDGYHVLEVLPGQGRAKLIFRADEMENANRRVRERFGVPEQSNGRPQGS